MGQVLGDRMSSANHISLSQPEDLPYVPPYEPVPDAPLTPEGRLRLVQRCQPRPIAHVAAEAGVSRQCLSKWVQPLPPRRRGRPDRSVLSAAAPARPSSTPTWWPRSSSCAGARKWSARLIALELTDQRPPGLGRDGRPVAGPARAEPAPLARRRRRTAARNPAKITARYRGHMVHLDVKKVGRIPDGGGWRVHGRGSDQHRAVDRAKTGRRPRRLRLPALRRRRVLPARLHRAPARRDRQAPRSGSGPAPGPSSPPTASPASPGSSPTTARATAPRRSPAPSRTPPGTSGSSRTRPSTTARWSATSGSSPRNCSTPALHLRSRTRPRDRRSGTSTTTTIDPTPPPGTSHPLNEPPWVRRRVCGLRDLVVGGLGSSLPVMLFELNRG